MLLLRLRLLIAGSGMLRGLLGRSIVSYRVRLILDRYELGYYDCVVVVGVGGGSGLL